MYSFYYFISLELFFHLQHREFYWLGIPWKKKNLFSVIGNVITYEHSVWNSKWLAYIFSNCEVVIFNLGATGFTQLLPDVLVLI